MERKENRLIRFTGLAARAIKSIQAMKTMNMARYGLSAAHTDLLCHLACLPEGATQRQLADREMIDKAQVSRVLRGLEERGLVQKSGGGAYRQRIFLTEKGRMVTEEMEAIISNLCRRVSGDIPQADLEIFYRTLETIVRNLGRVEAQVIRETGKNQWE